MPDLSPILNFLQQQMQTQPGLFIATVGLIVSSSYVLLMMVTRLGDIKPGVQSFVLSALIHGTMALFWGNLTLPEIKVAKRRPPGPIPIRQVIVEDQNGAEVGTTDGGSGSGNNSRAVWDRIASSPQEDFARVSSLPSETMPPETLERTSENLEPLKNALPDLPQTEQVTTTTPELAQIAEQTRRNAAEQMVDIGEETAESRPDGVATDAAPVRTMTDRARRSGETIEREGRPSPSATSDEKISVQIAAQPASRDLFPDQEAIELKQTDMSVARSRAGPVQNTVEIDEPGMAEGNPTSTEKVGSPNAGKFSRAGSPGSRNEVAGTLERSRPVVRSGEGTGSPVRAPAMASLGPQTARDVGPKTERPQISRPNFETIPQQGSAKVPDTYRLRNLPQRQKVAVRLGATQESERAVELSLRWLALHQNPEGYWDADGFDANCPERDRCWGRAGKGSPTETEKINNPVDRLALEAAGQQADTGLTALVILTFLGAGYTHEEGQYADQIDRALRWMIRQQQSNGYLGGKASHYERMYCHGMATYALGEACGMMADAESDPKLRQTLTRAVAFIVAMQNPTDGGWRYIDGHLPKQEGDMSMFGWQLMALKSSEIAGIEVPEDTRTGMIKFLRRISSGERRGLASYRFGEAPKLSMTAEALFSRQMLGVKRENPSSLEAIEYMAKHPPRLADQDLYYWYYGTLAMYQYGGEPWQQWNDQLRDTLVSTQRKEGHAAGSWDPRDNWSLHGGRLYSTALSTLCLEVYYRFLPLYQLNEAPADNPMGI